MNIIIENSKTQMKCYKKDVKEVACNFNTNLSIGLYNYQIIDHQKKYGLNTTNTKILSSNTKYQVVRDAKKELIDGILLVPGDIIFLKQGEAVPADSRIIECERLETDESILTGEFVSVPKQHFVITHDARIYDQFNMLFKGSSISNGWCKALVVATGNYTFQAELEKQRINNKFFLSSNKKMNFYKQYIFIFLFLTLIIFCASCSCSFFNICRFLLTHYYKFFKFMQIN